MVKVVIAGCGTIGKRVAEAVKKQDDMELYGIADVSQTGGLRTVLSEDGPLHGTHLYASNQEGKENLEEQGFYVEGLLEDQLDEIDVVVDCTPPGVDEANKENLYEPNDVKAVFQGGASDDIAEVKFNADANYEEARGEDFVKVVSCNTTSLSRTMSVVDERFGVESATANLVRRGGDIPQDGRGPINSTIPVTEVPSHHGPDVQAVMPELDITTLAVKVPVTFGHVHMVTVDLEEDISEEEAVQAFEDQPRVRLINAGEGYDSTGKVHEMMRDLERPRSDMPEAGVWRETIDVEDGKLRWIHMVHQESIVVPDNVDAIRAMFDMEDKETSIEMTNEKMHIE
ncbi:type II glyceraldehyde-3-phosphate dehydrogenase [Candidatus Nanohalobium constans]|uniref:Glyceraldehyde-3-phosphate dehydrogenase n=1 Tax=Candidatus Nanohalobium constans TaxID=2565781 RepID=A0A5Q0UEN6_9ARCH|nr:type II glyceraldehyde-3-phosphate dehydrogenase [Candidatus Nanohalobium constans]QGA80043.1 glyceraldehyde-3-phosphate dehydrogenase (NAD(P)) [Candidatus Nanohalobium constans]